MVFQKGHPAYTPKLSKEHKKKISLALKGKQGLKGEKNPKWKGEKPPCSICGNPLTKHYSWLPKEILSQKKCSSCYKEWQKIKGNNPNWKGERPTCKKCGKKLSLHNPKTSLCLQCYGIESRGEKHPKWKGDEAKEVSKLSRERQSPEILKWKKDIIKRDGLVCAICKKEDTRNNMHVDHIKPFAKYPYLRTSLENGRVLCKECHRKTKSYSIKISKPKENRVKSGEVQNG